MQKLAKQGASLTQMRAERHPSEPNYLALFSGSTQGVTSDVVPAKQFAGPSLGGELIAKGLTFAGYSESQPSAGFMGKKSGRYARKHNPWSDFADVPASSNLPLSSFPAGDFNKLPTVSFVVPNQKNDMHSGTAHAADDWLKSHLNAYVKWTKTHNSLLIVTWDEGRNGKNHIPTIFFGANVRKGNFAYPSNHYRLLRTIEAMYGLSPLGGAADNAPLRKIFKKVASPAPAMTQAVTASSVFSDQPVSHKRVIDDVSV
jgi:acid phosphatase